MTDHLDHLVLTTSRPQACIDFYTRVLGLRLEHFTSGTPPVQRVAFVFGQQKINLHTQGAEFEPRAHLPVPGSQDLCFIASVPLAAVIARLQDAGWPIILNPAVDRSISADQAHEYRPA